MEYMRVSKPCPLSVSMVSFSANLRSDMDWLECRDLLMTRGPSRVSRTAGKEERREGEAKEKTRKPSYPLLSNDVTIKTTPIKKILN